MGLVTSKRPLIDAEAQGTHMPHEFTNPILGSTRTPDLPFDIIIEILSKLPAMSLLRFRCVCKSWLSLISNKKFITKHLHMLTRDDNYSLQRVMFQCDLCGFSFKSCSLDAIYSDPCVNPITLDHRITIKEPIRYGSMVGSCDGLVCISTNEGIYLWNPTLRESRRLPRFKVVDIPQKYYSFYGFGYDYSSDDYKVVAVTSTSTPEFPYNTQVDVYTLSSNSWRRIQAIPRGGRIWSRGIFFKGALHWVLPLSLNTWTIIALDLATETYHEIARPTDGDFKYNRMLGVLGGCLCVMMSDIVGDKIIVWIMKEYGLENSWTKLACFPIVAHHGFHKTIGYYPCNLPLFVSKTDEMCVIYKSMINLYNLKDKTSRSPLIRHSLDCTYSATYVESLVSLGVEDSVDGQPEFWRKIKRRKK